MNLGRIIATAVIVPDTDEPWSNINGWSGWHFTPLHINTLERIHSGKHR